MAPYTKIEWYESKWRAYAPNIPMDRGHLWHIMLDALPKDCEWIIGGNFDMTRRPQDKSKDCGRAISDLERFTWNGLLTAFQIHGHFIHQGGPRFSWSNGQRGNARRLARLHRFYMPTHNRLGIHPKAYFIHGCSVGWNHSPVQLEISTKNEDVRNTAFKWNVSYLQGDNIDMIEEKWNRCLRDAIFFYKLRQITRFYKQMSKQEAKEFQRDELDTRANLERAIAVLHEDVYNEAKQGEVNKLRHKVEEIETRKARGAVVRSRVK